jgi:hypothetical protein
MAKTTKPTAPAKKRRDTDWDAVERDYRTGKFTLRELSEKYGPSHQAIGNQSKKRGWTQDLGVAIKQATNAKLVAELVDKEIANGGQKVANTVLAAAELNKQVILQHRGDIKSAREVAADLLQELKDARLLSEHKELLAKILAGPDADAKSQNEARKAVARALDLGSRVFSLKALTEAFTKLQTAERQAFGLDSGDGNDPDPDKNSLASLILGMRRSSLPVVKNPDGDE